MGTGSIRSDSIKASTYVPLKPCLLNSGLLTLQSRIPCGYEKEQAISFNPRAKCSDSSSVNLNFSAHDLKGLNCVHSGLCLQELPVHPSLQSQEQPNKPEKWFPQGDSQAQESFQCPLPTNLFKPAFLSGFCFTNPKHPFSGFHKQKIRSSPFLRCSF